MSPNLLVTLALCLAPPAAPADLETAALALSPAEVKQAFHKLLDRPGVALDVVAQSIKTDPEAGLTTEILSFASEKKADGSIERVPVLVVRPAEKADDGTGVTRRPAVIVLHGTGGTKEGTRTWLVDLAKRGIIGVAIDARYHGARAGGAKGAAAYNAAITRAWRVKPETSEPQEHPFYYDTVWDLWRTVDYLQTRRDIAPDRIGMIGISMGGIETWLAASVDERVAVAVPAIAVQSFRWSLEHEKWQGRARTIALAHQAAAADLGESEVNAKVCRALWPKIIPGILGPFDAPSMIRLFADRPLLILNGELDPNCPIEGAEIAFDAARAAYQEKHAADRLEINVARGVAHTVTPAQRTLALDWFVRWLKP